MFVLKMGLREMRASWRRLVFFFVCVAIGVGAIVALRSVIQNVRDAMSREAKVLTAADLLVQSNRPWSDRARRVLEARLLETPDLAASESVETATMVRPAEGDRTAARMVELRAIEEGFPYYGTLELTDGRPYSHLMLVGRGALVRPELLGQLGVDVGDRILIGDATFTIVGTIRNEPGRRVGLFSFGPRVLIHLDDLEKTGLVGVGSRVRHQILLRVPEPILEPLVTRLRYEFREEFVSIRSYKDREDDIGEDFERAENYLSLVGFVILALGGIGVWSVTRVFVQQRMRSIAVLKCLGASSRQVLAIYVAQVLVLALAGSLLGVGLAAAAVALVPTDVAIMAQRAEYGLTQSAILQGVGTGVLVSLLFALVPLLDVRRIKPLLLLRHEAARLPSSAAARGGRFWPALDVTKAAAVAAVTAALVALAIWQAASPRIGLYVSVGFAGVAIALHLTGALLVRLLRPLAAAGSFPLRHAVMNLSRPGNQTRVILLSVGLGSFFILAVQSLQANLLDQFDIALRTEEVDMFMIDIQQDQAEPLEALVERHTSRAPRMFPVLRARVTSVLGREVRLESLEDVRGQGSLGREYVVTYRDHLQPNEEILAGKFWGDEGAPAYTEPEVSIEERLNERFGIAIGDYIVFDILSREVRARVSSIRRVDWNDPRNGGFMFVFRPESLAGAPHGYVALLRGPDDLQARAVMQREVVDRFPNVSVVDMREILRTAEQVIGNVSLAISIVGLIALLSGGLILVGAVAMTKFQRIYEAAIFKTLGANTRSLATMLVLEYGVLGVLAGLIGSLGAIALSWSLCRWLLDISWTFPAAENLAGVAVTTLVVAIVGVTASLDVLRRKPLATLRAE